jgi:hypothetical protein
VVLTSATKPHIPEVGILHPLSWLTCSVMFLLSTGRKFHGKYLRWAIRFFSKSFQITGILVASSAFFVSPGRRKCHYKSTEVNCCNSRKVHSRRHSKAPTGRITSIPSGKDCRFINAESAVRVRGRGLKFAILKFPNCSLCLFTSFRDQVPSWLFSFLPHGPLI